MRTKHSITVGKAKTLTVGFDRTLTNGIYNFFSSSDTKKKHFRRIEIAKEYTLI
jgi:hypothetical protein